MVARERLRANPTPPAGDDGELAPWSITHATSSDVDEQAANLRGWDQVYEQLSPGRFVGSLHEIRFPGVQLFRETTNQAVHEAGAPRGGSRAIGVPMRLAGASRFRGAAVDADALITLGSADELDFYAPRGFDIVALVVDEHSLERHAREVEHRDLAPAFAGNGVLRPGVSRRDEFGRLLTSVLQSAEVNPSAFRYRQSQRVLEQSMLGAVVAAVVDDAAPRPADARERRQHIVDAAKNHMRSRIAEPITVADLCRELGVSRRTLQYSFQEVLGIKPVWFLRAMRLNGVRRELRGGAPGAGTVQDTAARWGFWHLGHFVTEYKQMFGELPSQTLRGKPSNGR
ncbi:MAG TPA: helix-turn-helix domain-containing protein [Casimicrobiaceae bacterium]|nr:helix-turn-helix domain-containing protein [Casimicrobiaceae bacterium]